MMAETRPPTTKVQVESQTRQPLHHRASTSTGPQARQKMSCLLIVMYHICNWLHLFAYVE